MNKILYPGSFDPITLGHLDIIKRASRIADKLVVAIVININKKSAFSVEQRMDFIKRSIGDLKNVEITTCNGLLVDYAKSIGATTIVRGLRAVTDFEYELQMAQTNSKLYPKIETIFMATRLEYSYLSSSIVKEVAMFGGDIKGFLPEYIVEDVENVLKGE